MKQLNTKYNNKRLTPALVIILIVFYAVFLIIPPYLVHKIIKAPLTEVGLFQTNSSKALFILPLVLLFGLALSFLIGTIVGAISGKGRIFKENRIAKKTNPYIYYRELPNDFGVGVTSLLLDSKIENYKDIVAVILDLCAKKYISLIKQDDKYCIKILKSIDKNLLSNEKYILSLLISKDIKNINYQEWYNYCLQDGIDLNLYYHNEQPKEGLKPLLTKEIMKKRHKMQVKISLVIAIIIFVIFILGRQLIPGIFISLFFFAVVYIILIVPFYLLNVFTGFVNMGKMQQKIQYEITLNNHLTRTKKGIEEFHKLMSFRDFLTGFGYFVDKRAEEVILWDRYLSYAQVFGLTKEIMDTGYKELVSNSSFQIDNIDNINLYNIDFE